MTDVAVVLHGPEHVAAALAAHTGRSVRLPSSAAALPAASAVVGVATAPWPGFQAAHEQVRELLAPTPYYAIQAWHRHPAYLSAMAAAVTVGLEAVGDDIHVVFTAPGPGPDAAPGELVFLREVAEAVSTRLRLTRRSIAWVGGETGPSMRTALSALAEAHGQRTVLRASLDTSNRDDDVHAEAAEVGIELHEARIRPGSLPALLGEVVETVAVHEHLGRDR